ncbi:MAG TPA: hypothetical protein VJR92_10265 [Gemmatimonadaceae bacterium]|nr:hypothetical protein [Gemmatimonadaceae bacterium]
MKKITTFALAAALSFSAACGDDEIAAATGDTLTTEEFGQMATAFSGLGSVAFQAFLDAANAGGPGAPSGMAAQQSTTINFNRTVECPAGGTANVTGVLAATGQTTVGLTVTQTMTDCALVDADESVWVFNSNPNIRWSATGTVNQETGAFTLNATWNGRFEWSSADAEKEGGCSVNLSLTITGNKDVGNFTATLEGTVCGVTVEDEFSYNPA